MAILSATPVVFVCCFRLNQRVVNTSRRGGKSILCQKNQNQVFKIREIVAVVCPNRVAESYSGSLQYFFFFPRVLQAFEIAIRNVEHTLRKNRHEAG